jgi:hypothetical protein
MPLTDFQAYSRAHDLLKQLIASQSITLPSSNGTVSDPGATDAKYIKDLMTGLTEFFKTIPNQ